MPKPHEPRPQATESLDNLKSRLHPYKQTPTHTTQPRSRSRTLKEYQKLWIQDDLDRVDGLEQQQANDVFFNLKESPIGFDVGDEDDDGEEYPSSEASTEILPENMPKDGVNVGVGEWGREKVVFTASVEDEYEHEGHLEGADSADVDGRKAKKTNSIRTRPNTVRDRETKVDRPLQIPDFLTIGLATLATIAIGIMLLSPGYCLKLVISLILFFAPLPGFLPRWSLVIPLVLPMCDKARLEVALFLMLVSWLGTLELRVVGERVGREVREVGGAGTAWAFG